MDNFEITVVRDRTRSAKSDWITEEIPLTIDLNGKELVTLLASPRDLPELVYGFLFTSGFIKYGSDIKGVTIDRQRWRSTVTADAPAFIEELHHKRMYTSGCGRGTIYYNALDLLQRARIESGVTVAGEKIMALMQKFQKSSLEFKNTGGVHSAALCDQEDFIILMDDIGRHNAIDKVIGKALTNSVDFEDKIILTSGRISSEIVLKLSRCRIPVIASAGAPTNQAVKLARDMNITLAGFVRGRRMNLYSAEGRIK